MEEEEMLMYENSPYFCDDAYRHHGWYVYKPYWWWYGHGWKHHGWHKDREENQRHDYGYMPKPMPMPMPCPMPVQPVQPMPVQPIQKNYKEIKSLEKNVNITEINNTIIQIEQKYPYIMKKLLMMGIAYAECKKIIYLTLLCSGKFDL